MIHSLIGWFIHSFIHNPFLVLATQGSYITHSHCSHLLYFSWRTKLIIGLEGILQVFSSNPLLSVEIFIPSCQIFDHSFLESFQWWNTHNFRKQAVPLLSSILQNGQKHTHIYSHIHPFWQIFIFHNSQHTIYYCLPTFFYFKILHHFPYFF